jgi:phenylacetyl-CoA:acceptor oxidoreductase subunit 1
MSEGLAMVVDLRRCVGCQTCTAACRSSNATPEGVTWRRVLDLEVGSYPDVTRVFLPAGCHQCRTAPCVGVCPAGASTLRPDGIIAVDHQRCLGCGSCVVVCPFQARYLEPRDAASLRRGTAGKCDFCAQRIDAAYASSLLPGSTPEVTPACVNACIAHALSFGSLDEPGSEVSRLIATGAARQLGGEEANGPRIYYIAADPEER